ncbi:MAG TPA: type I 3-dehydroquinate dehydratase [Thermoplasmata archaeon]|nr:type I 3-dehydroquinate dehydratase [Thermoplasmata archaeon]
MTRAPPAVIVTIPARSASEAASQVGAAARAGADGAEIRFDRWPAAERLRSGALFPSALPLLATLRSRTEGGEGPDPPDERAAELLRLSEQPFRWIDLELERDLPVLPRLPAAETLGRIVSCHLPPGRFAEWGDRRQSLAASGGVGKLVVPAPIGVVLREMIPALAARADEGVTVLTTGPSGPLLRVLARRLGFPIVFASLPAAAGLSAVEPSQLPVDRLRPFLDADGEPPLFGVGGRPIAHSQSPAVHSAWMRAEGRLGAYLPLEFRDEDEFVEAIPLLADLGFRGLNVTLPYKVAAFEAATDAGPGAEACRAANCLTFREREILAENTDLAAILRRLEELRGAGAWDGIEVAVIGTGGAARATLAATRILGLEATLYSRGRDAGRALAQEFGARALDPSEAEPTSLVVHATAAGRDGAGRLDGSLHGALTAGRYLLDWAYRPIDSGVEEAARSAGIEYEDGWRLFVYQAAASYSLWWGEEPAAALVERTISEGECAA